MNLYDIRTLHRGPSELQAFRRTRIAAWTEEEARDEYLVRCAGFGVDPGTILTITRVLDE